MKKGWMIKALVKAFPGIEGIRAGEELGYSKGSIFLGNAAEGGEIDGLPACDYYSEDYKEVVYVMGVHKKLRKVLEDNGWFAECHDPGTWLAYEK